MIPLVPSIALALVSFAASAFVILRVLVPILPPSPFSRRVPPSEFGLPNFRTLAPADKAHLWLAFIDLLALATFCSQVLVGYLGPPDSHLASDVGGSVRLWVAMSVRQTFLLVIMAVTLLHVRSGRPVTFGSTHWFFWLPAVVLVAVSTSVAAAFVYAGVASFFVGLVAYSGIIAALTTFLFACLFVTLLVIKRNLAALNRVECCLPVERKPRPPFTTEEIDALRDGGSWITSNASMHLPSVSAWSLSTYTRRSTHASVPAVFNKDSQPSVPAKSSFWFNAASSLGTKVPPVPPLPSPYRNPHPNMHALENAHGFMHPGLDRCLDPSGRNLPDSNHIARLRNGSQTSWLSSTKGSHMTLSSWSYPTSNPGSSSPDLHTELLHSRPATPVAALASSQVLGGYAPASTVKASDPEVGLASLAIEGSSIDLDISALKVLSWLALIWIPYCLGLSYLSMVIVSDTMSSSTVAVLLILSVTISSPLLALNILTGSPIPIPQGLFDVRPQRYPADGCIPSLYKRSNGGSMTAIEGRRSGDVWISQGDAVDGRTSKFARALGMLERTPKLSLLPPTGDTEDRQMTPPLPMQIEETPETLLSADMAALKNTSSKEESYSTTAMEEASYSTRIMVAQRHYSVLAQTVLVPASEEKVSAGREDSSSSSGTTTAINLRKNSNTTHQRVGSVSSTSADVTAFSITSPPPSIPLPSTPPSVKAMRLAKLSREPAGPSGMTRSDDVTESELEIDSMSAWMLPMLVPGLKVGDGVKVSGEWSFQSRVTPKAQTKSARRHKKGNSTGRVEELRGLEEDPFSSPETHSTPAGRTLRARKDGILKHRKNRLSLPSFSQDSVHSLAAWKEDINRALESTLEECSAVEEHLRNTDGVSEQDSTSLPRARTTSPGRVEDNQSDPVAALLRELEGVIAPPSAASTVNGDVTVRPLEADGMSQHVRQNPVQPHKASQSRAQNEGTAVPIHPRSRVVYVKSGETPPQRPSWFEVNGSDRKTAGVNAHPHGGGLRPLALALLRERDMNTAGSEAGPARPRKATGDGNGNATKTRHLRPLRLARSETTKLRGVLRREEVLPRVVVRPPSGM